MRAHKGFFNWVMSLSPPDVSPQGILFAKEELVGQHEAATTERWLRDRQDKALRKKWLNLTQAERGAHLLRVQDVSFPLGGASTGILDSRHDPSCYPRRGEPADTPTIVQAPPRPSSTAIPAPSDRAFSQFLELHGELSDAVLKAALTAELTAMAMAVRENDAQSVALRAAAVVDCLGGSVGSATQGNARSNLLGIIRDVSESMGATRMLFHEGLHTVTEAKEAVQTTHTAVVEANASLRDFTSSAMNSNARYKAAYPDRQLVPVTATRYLREVSWMDTSGGVALETETIESAAEDSNSNDGSIPEGNNSSSGYHSRAEGAKQTAESSGSQDPGVSEQSESEQRSIAESVKKKPRACVSKKARQHYYFG